VPVILKARYLHTKATAHSLGNELSFCDEKLNSRRGRAANSLLISVLSAQPPPPMAIFYLLFFVLMTVSTHPFAVFMLRHFFATFLFD
jgi:hypothetical protein